MEQVKKLKSKKIRFKDANNEVKEAIVNEITNTGSLIVKLSNEESIELTVRDIELLNL